MGSNPTGSVYITIFYVIILVMTRTFKTKWSMDACEDLFVGNTNKNKISFIWELFFTDKEKFSQEIEYIKAGVETLNEVLQYEMEKEIIKDMKKTFDKYVNQQINQTSHGIVKVGKIGKFPVYRDTSITFDRILLPKFKDSIVKMWCNYWETGKATVWPSLDNVFQSHDAGYIYAPYIPIQFTTSDVFVNKWNMFMYKKCGGVKTKYAKKI